MNYPIIDVHASWLVVNPIQGCPNGCKYCFLNGMNKTKVKPEVLATPEEAVNELMNSKYYTKDIPICFFSQTDAFATVENKIYLMKVLEILHNKKVYNPKIFITKCYIPDDFIEYITQIEKEGEKVVFYLSYSGLDRNIEVGINKENNKKNFERLFAKGKKIIHYWRPFLPQNSSKEKIEEVLNFVSKYSLASVITGLKVHESFIDKLNFWPEILQNKQEVLRAEGVWPKDIYEYFWNKSDEFGDYPIFQSNSCALAYALGQEDRNAFFRTELCTNINNCQPAQRIICEKFYSQNNICEKNIYNILEKLNIDASKNIITIKNIKLDICHITFITQLTRMKVIVGKKDDDIYWNTSVNSAKPFLI